MTSPFEKLSIESLCLSTRTTNCLRAAGIRRVEDLFSFSPESILDVRGAGRKVFSELCDVFEKLRRSHADRFKAVRQDSTKGSGGSVLDLSKVSSDQLVSLLRPVDDYLLSYRTYRVLRDAKAKRIGDLIQLSSRQILSIDGAGRKTVNEVVTLVQRVGFDMPTIIQGWTPEAVAGLSKSCLSALDELRQKELEAELAQTGSINLDGLATWLLSQYPAGRDRELLRVYQGWYDAREYSLQDTADMFDLTRERVRQVNVRFEKSIRRRNLRFRQVEDVLTRLRVICPCEVNEALCSLVESGLISSRMSLLGISNLASFVGKSAARYVQLHKIEGKAILMRADLRVTLEELVSLSRKAARSDGIGNLEEVSSFLSNSCGQEMSYAELRKFIDYFDEFEWVDEQKEWFWLRELVTSRRNRLVNYIRKIMTVAGNIDIGELRKGIQRPHRSGGKSPPKRVLAEVCKRLSFCQLVDERVCRKEDLDPDIELKGIQGQLYRVLKAAGGVMDRHKLFQACESLGINESSFSMNLGYAAIIKRVDAGVYSLIGCNPSPGLIGELASHMTRRTHKVLTDHGWTRDGSPWILYKLSIGLLQGGVLTIPSSLQGIIQGEYDIVDTDNYRICKLVVKGPQGSGMKTLFRRSGSEEGDYLLIKIDLKKRIVITRLGGDEIGEDVDLLANATSVEDEVAG